MFWHERLTTSIGYKIRKKDDDCRSLKTARLPHFAEHDGHDQCQPLRDAGLLRWERIVLRVSCRQPLPDANRKRKFQIRSRTSNPLCIPKSLNASTSPFNGIYTNTSTMSALWKTGSEMSCSCSSFSYREDLLFLYSISSHVSQFWGWREAFFS